MFAVSEAVTPMKSPKKYPVGAYRATMVSVVLAAIILVAYFTSAVRSRAAPNIVPEPDRHSVIAVTCPYAPFFGIGGSNDSELLMNGGDNTGTGLFVLQDVVLDGGAINTFRSNNRTMQITEIAVVDEIAASIAVATLIGR